MGVPIKTKSYRQGTESRSESGICVFADSLYTRARKGFRPANPLGTKVSHLFAQAFACQSLLDSLLLTRFQVEGMLPDILDNVFLLNLPFEAPQRAFKRFAIIENYFSQAIHLLIGQSVTLPACTGACQDQNPATDFTDSTDQLL
jgi:hypothetical protein